jgi:hypothetical protein
MKTKLTVDKKEQKQRKAAFVGLIYSKRRRRRHDDDAGEQQTSSSSSSSTTKGDILLSNVLLPSPPLGGVFISVLYAPKRGKKIIVPTRNIGQRRRGKCERRGDGPTTTPRERSSDYHCHSSQGTTTPTATTPPDERNADEE